MNRLNPVPEWTVTLRHLAAGATIAAVLLVPAVSPPAIRIQSRSSGEGLRLATSIPDGCFDPRMARFRTRAGLSTAYPLVDQPEEEEDDPAFLPMRLREVSGLPVALLARLVGVSKVAYHNWLKGEGISEANSARLAGLLETLRALHDLRGPGLGEFLETRGTLGRPIELLQRGDTDTVLGLALRPVSTVANPPIVADDSWAASGLEGWISPVASLNWGATRSTEEALRQTLLAVNARPWMGDGVAIEESDELPFVAHIQFVG